MKARTRQAGPGQAGKCHPEQERQKRTDRQNKTGKTDRQNRTDKPGRRNRTGRVG
jgi:hypothetical protein